MEFGVINEMSLWIGLIYKKHKKLVLFSLFLTIACDIMRKVQYKRMFYNIIVPINRVRRNI